MAKAKFDITTLELPAAATKPLYAGVGATDLAVEAVRDYVADVQNRFAGVQKNVKDIDFEPKALREQAVTVAKSRRAAVEARVTDNVSAVSDTYADLARRGESLVGRIRKQEATKATVSSAKTTSAKAKTTQTQASKATKSTAKSAKSKAKKSSGPARSSAKATTTAAKKTASNAARATSDAASKVGS